MAQPALDYFRKRGLTFKAEGTEGTDSVPTVGTDGVMILNGNCTTEFDKDERVIDRPFFTNNGFAIANERAIIEGEIELYSPATPGQASTSSSDKESVLLPAGFTVVKAAGPKTTYYNPISASIPSGTAYWYHVDKLIKALGARCNLSALKMEIGKRFTANLRVMGTFQPVTEGAMPTITLPTTVPTACRFSNTTAYLDPDASGGGAEVLVWAKSLSIDLGNDLMPKEYTSVRFNTISDRLATWTMRIARTAIADFNPWALRTANTIISGRMRKFEGASPGIFSELGFRGQIETITPVDIDKDYGWDLSGPCVASSAGGDELYILFGNTA